jgi:hypothetical protein
VGGPGYGGINVGEGGSNVGAAFVYIRSGGAWAISKVLAGTGHSGESGQGTSVALSCNTFILGGPSDGNGIGGAWVFADPLQGCLLGH